MRRRKEEWRLTSAQRNRGREELQRLPETARACDIDTTRELIPVRHGATVYRNRLERHLSTTQLVNLLARFVARGRAHEKRAESHNWRHVLPATARFH